MLIKIIVITFVKKNRMKKYIIKFEFYRKKMQTEIIAETEEEAKRKVIDRLHFVEIKEVEYDRTVEYLKTILKMK